MTVSSVGILARKLEIAFEKLKGIRKLLENSETCGLDSESSHFRARRVKQ